MTDEVRERPILFSTPMVPALLDGRKTQTRRPIKPRPEHGACRCGYTRTGWAFATADDACTCKPIQGPPGDVGDRLWVRETFQLLYETPDTWMGGGGEIDLYGGPIPKTGEEARRDSVFPAFAADDIEGPFRPSIFMPRWASRITLEVTGVRVERLQAITEEDAKAEGVGPGYVPNSQGSTTCVGHRPMFARLWNEINGGKEGCSWSDNPWVFAISFRGIKP